MRKLFRQEKLPNEKQNLINKLAVLLRQWVDLCTLYKPHQMYSGFRGFIKGSIIIEAALTFPFFLFAVAEVIQWTNFLNTEINLLREVSYKARIIAEVRSMEEPSEDNVIEITKGEKLRGVFFTRTAKARVFTGRYYDGEGKDGENSLVFVTKHGRVYHRNLGCPHINLKIKSVDGREVGKFRSSDGSKYYPCRYCVKKKVWSRVYITEDGNRFHLEKNCKALKREVKFVTLGKAKKNGYGCCKTCGY